MENDGRVLLILFLLAVINYFSLLNLIEQYLYLRAAVKVLPITALYLFARNLKRSTYRRPERVECLKIGLFFSGIGDICLVWPHLFLFGLISFSITHFYYTRYFENRHRNDILGLCLFAVDGSIIYQLFSTFDGILAVAIPFYSFLLACMLWRSCDQMNGTKITMWSACGVAGGIMFTISDLLLLFDMFVKHHSVFHVLTMAMYYLGQLAIVLNVLK